MGFGEVSEFNVLLYIRGLSMRLRDLQFHYSLGDAMVEVVPHTWLFGHLMLYFSVDGGRKPMVCCLQSEA